MLNNGGDPKGTGGGHLEVSLLAHSLMVALPARITESSHVSCLTLS